MSVGTRTQYRYVPHDPTAGTAASGARASSAAEVGSQHTSRVTAPAHAAPVPSQQPLARGRGYTFGASAGALPSRAVPAWRQVAVAAVARAVGAPAGR
jgi:hypothetical protein